MISGGGKCPLRCDRNQAAQAGRLSRIRGNVVFRLTDDVVFATNGYRANDREFVRIPADIEQSTDQ